MNAPVQRAITANENDSALAPTLSPSATIPVGVLAILTYDCEDAQLSTVTDSKGNTWTKVGSDPGAESGVFGSVWYCVPTTQILATDTITITRTATFQRPFNYVLYTVDGWTGTPTLDASPSTAVGSGTGTALTAGTTGVPQAPNSLGFVFWACQKNLAITVTAPYTGLTETGTTAGGIGTPHSRAAYNILAAAAAQTPAGTRAAGTSAFQGIACTFSDVVGGAPVNTVAPVVSGSIAAGATLSTTDGTWTGTPTSFAYQWQRDGSNGTWVNIAGATGNTRVLSDLDIGSHIRCDVTATNANGNTLAHSNSVGVIPAPAGVFYSRIVGGPIAQSDATAHSVALIGAVLPGEFLVCFAACSNANTIDVNGNKSDVGSVTDSGSNTWTQDCEAFSDANILHSAQAFSAPCAAGLAIGANVTLHVHNDFPPGYHGQSPYYIVLALSTGDGRTFALDQQAHGVDLLTAHAAPNITTSVSNAVVLGFHVVEAGAAGGWWTPGAGFTEYLDSIGADQPPNGGESAYNISGEVKIVSAGYTGGAGGSTGGNKATTNLVVAYRATGGTSAVSNTAQAVLEAEKALAVALSAPVLVGQGIVATVLGPWEAKASPQILKPASDISAGLWTPSTGVSLFATIDETVPDDADFDTSSSSPVTPDIMEVKLQAGNDPGISDDGSEHHIRYRIFKSIASADRLDVTVRLMMGAIQIASWTHTDISTVAATFDQTLSNAQANNIVNYSDLRLRFEAVKE